MVSGSITQQISTASWLLLTQSIPMAEIMVVSFSALAVISLASYRAIRNKSRAMAVDLMDFTIPETVLLHTAFPHAQSLTARVRRHVLARPEDVQQAWVIRESYAINLSMIAVAVRDSWLRHQFPVVFADRGSRELSSHRVQLLHCRCRTKSVHTGPPARRSLSAWWQGCYLCTSPAWCKYG